MKPMSHKKTAPSRIPRAIASPSWILPCGFISLALLWCQVGYLTPATSRALGGILWLAAVCFAAQERRLLWVVASGIVLFNPWGAVHQASGLWLLGLLPWAGGRWGRRWMGAALLAAAGYWIWRSFPGVWVALDDRSAELARGITDSNLSSAAAGVPLLALAVCFPIAAMLSERKFFAPLVTIGALIVTLAVYWTLIHPLDVQLHRLRVHGVHDAFSLQWALLFLLGIVLWVWNRLDPPAWDYAAEEVAKKRSPLIVWAAAALLGAGALLIGWSPRPGAPAARTIVFYDGGYLNWNKPEYGNYGAHSAGMFGLIPDFLHMRGFDVALQDSLTQETLAKAGVVVIINLMQPLGAEEEAALHQFVADGGALLLLGDHTGLANIREPSNRLLAPYGIELNFDTAKPLRTGWAGSLVTAQSPVTAGLKADRLCAGGGDAVTQIWVGASLKVIPPAQPVILGRDGFADLGNEKNERDGYLGDFIYRLEERLGNLVLLAQARSGKGKVLVFGDTSSLQNGALVRSGDFVVQVFNDLLTPQKPPSLLLKVAGLVCLLAALLIAAKQRFTYSFLLLASLALFVAVSVVEIRAAEALKGSGREWTAEAPPRALLDHTHQPRTPLNMTSNDSYWGLQNTLMRSGFIPLALESWDIRKLRDARILVETAPAKSFSRRQRDELRRFMERGGVIILSCGMEEFDGSRGLLREMGVEPVYVPLGPAQIADTLQLPVLETSGDSTAKMPVTVRFHELWGIRLANENARVMLSGYDQPLVVFLPHGEGGLLYIPDTDFLANLNLESPSGDYHEGNILFLRFLLRELAGGR